MIEKLIASLPGRTPEERLRMRQNAEAMAAGADKKKAEQAKALLEAMDAFERLAADCDRERLMNLPLVDRIEEAFRREPPTDTELKMIRALADQRVDNSTSALAWAIGWESGYDGGGCGWNLHFGRMCSKREAFIEPSPKRSSAWDDKYFSKLLATVEEVRETLRYEFKSEAIEAFIRLGLVSHAARSCASDRKERMDAERRGRQEGTRVMLEAIQSERESAKETEA